MTQKHNIIYAPHSRSLEQLIEEAIDLSTETGEIAHIEQATGAVLLVLERECEGSARGDEFEYWGRDIDGGNWRVHVQLRGEEPV